MPMMSPEAPLRPPHKRKASIDMGIGLRCIILLMAVPICLSLTTCTPRKSLGRFRGNPDTGGRPGKKGDRKKGILRRRQGFPQDLYASWPSAAGSWATARRPTCSTATGGHGEPSGSAPSLRGEREGESRRGEARVPIRPIFPPRSAEEIHLGQDRGVDIGRRPLFYFSNVFFLQAFRTRPTATGHGSVSGWT